MKKAIIFALFALAFSALSGSCGSSGNIGGFGADIVNDTSFAGIIVQGEGIGSASDNTQLNVVLDGKTIGTIASREVKGCRLKNGQHTIYFEHRGKPQGRSSPVNFTVSNDRRYFNINFDIKDKGTYSETVFNTAHRLEI